MNKSQSFDLERKLSESSSKEFIGIGSMTTIIDLNAAQNMGTNPFQKVSQIEVAIKEIKKTCPKLLETETHNFAKNGVFQYFRPDRGTFDKKDANGVTSHIYLTLDDFDRLIKRRALFKSLAFISNDWQEQSFQSLSPTIKEWMTYYYAAYTVAFNDSEMSDTVMLLSMLAWAEYFLWKCPAPNSEQVWTDIPYDFVTCHSLISGILTNYQKDQKLIKASENFVKEYMVALTQWTEIIADCRIGYQGGLAMKKLESLSQSWQNFCSSALSFVKILEEVHLNFLNEESGRSLKRVSENEDDNHNWMKRSRWEKV